jgi:hypothetical protein
MAISSPEMMLVPVSVSYGEDEDGVKLVRTEVDVTKGATADFAADSVLVAHAEVLLRSALSLFMCTPCVVTSGVEEAYHCRHACSGFNLKEVDLFVRVRVLRSVDRDTGRVLLW